MHTGRATLHASHVLAVRRPWVFCTNCGHYTSTADQAAKPKKLAEPCKGHCTVASASYLQRLQDGKPPLAALEEGRGPFFKRRRRKKAW